MIRVLLAEDQALVRGALKALLEMEGDIVVVGEAARADEVVPLARETQPHVALLDIELPGGSGLIAAAALRESLPECRVVMLTTFGRPGYVQRALAAGAHGFLLKDAPAAELAVAIRRVLQGQRVVAPDLALMALQEGPSPLTQRESEVLAAAAGGATTADISASLHLSEGTVRNHLSSAIQKLGARTRTEAVRIAKERGWL
ncbi:MAG: response regulator transcription factor [Firmicutes bacterium]|nr:response regulator transcription factor [Bacillota bacterium]